MSFIISHLEAIAEGVIALLFVKYILTGLLLWNRIFHPGRKEGKRMKPFFYPFLGLFGK